MKIEITKDGPYLISGKVPLSEYRIESHNNDYKLVFVKKYDVPETYALCRCGKSKNAPFCDGNHLAIKFNGKLTNDENKTL